MRPGPLTSRIETIQSGKVGVAAPCRVGRCKVDSSMSDVMSSLLPTLVAAQHFEQAAVATLRTMLRQVAEETSRHYAQQGRVLRGLVQLRPHDTYQRLLALEWED